MTILQTISMWKQLSAKSVRVLCITVYSIDINISAPPGEGRGDHVWVGEVVAEDEEAGVPRLVRHDSSLNSIALYRL